MWVVLTGTLEVAGLASIGSKSHYVVCVKNDRGYYNEEEFDSLEEAESFKAEEESTEGVTGTLNRYLGD